MSVGKKFLIPAVGLSGDHVIYATDDDEFGARHERNPQPGAPIPDSANRGGLRLKAGRERDIPVLKHLDAEVRLVTTGDIGTARMLWKRQAETRFKGKSDFCNWEDQLIARTTDGGTEVFLHPHVIALSNGELIISWAEHASSSTTDASWNWYTRVFSPETYQFGPIIALPTVTAGGVSVERSTRSDSPAIAIAESDIEPGHLVAVGVANSANGSNPTAFHLVVHTSYDFGRTWRLQNVDTVAWSSSTGPKSCDVVFHRGRLVFAGSVNTATTDVVFLYSTDNGLTWADSALTASSFQYSEGGVSLVRTHNDALLCAAGLDIDANDGRAGLAWSGDGGVSWEAFNDVDFQSLSSSTTDSSSSHWPALFLDDSGYAGCYLYCRTAATTRDGCFLMRTLVRDVTQDHVDGSTVIFENGTDFYADVRESIVWDEAAATLDPSIKSLSATNWRGRIAIVTSYEDSENTLLLHFSNVWNDLRYKNSATDGNPSWLYLYLPNDYPDTLGTAGYAWTLTGQSTNNLLLENGGLYIEDDTTNADYYTSPTFSGDPNIIRVICRVLSGGSTASPVVYWEVRNNTNDTMYQCRMSTTGFVFTDLNGAGGDIHNEVSTDLTKWHEFVVETDSDEMVQIWWRVLDPVEDGEHQQYNKVLGANFTLDATSHANNYVVFGHAATASSKSEWRHVSMQLAAGSATGSGVDVYDPDDPLDKWDSSAGTFGTAARPPKISEDIMHLADGVGVAWYGAAGLSGVRWDVETRSEFGKEMLIESGPSNPWAADVGDLDAGDYINLVLDAGVDRKFHLDSIALFGTNVPFFTVELNDVDEWSSPAVSMTSSVGTPTLGSSFRRQEKVRGPLGTVDYELNADSIDGNAVNVSAANQTNVTPLRPHQYQPKGTRKWYLVHTTSGYVWEIADNTSDTIYLTQTVDAVISDDDDLAVMSDRILIDMTQDGTLSLGVGYRFLRIQLGHASLDTRLRDEDGYLKIGKIVLGALEAIPDPEWGFSVRYEPNLSFVRGLAGTVQARSLGPTLERWTMAWPAFPSEVLDDVNYLTAGKTNQALAEQLFATGQGLQSIVMVHDSYDLTDTNWYRVTGNDLTLVRAIGAIDVRMDSYIPIENCGASARLGIMGQIGGLVFDEEA